MENVSNTTNMSFRVDKKLKKEADDIEKGKIKVKKYKSFDDALKDIDE